MLIEYRLAKNVFLCAFHAESVRPLNVIQWYQVICVHLSLKGCQLNNAWTSIDFSLNGKSLNPAINQTFNYLQLALKYTTEPKHYEQRHESRMPFNNCACQVHASKAVSISLFLCVEGYKIMGDNKDLNDFRKSQMFMVKSISETVQLVAW